MIKTRFAPSPTGHLHIGSVRTALYSWLYAKKMRGIFLLRIEDTDLERSTQESVDNILEGMRWLGLTHDEGPFYQTDRLDRYRAIAQTLLDTGQAYYCYCSKERLETLREGQLARKEKPRYDGHCRENQILQNQPHVIRFKTPATGTTSFKDAIHGEISINNSELDDLVIIRTDGMPTYNFVVAVDDMDMEITHVIRGEDHISNTPRQINILKALHANIPIYAHAPTILGSDGKRLSKRHGATNVLQYRDEGYLPESLLNYLVRLGWSHGNQEIFSLDEMIEWFDLEDVNKAAAIFNSEKLIWLNQHYLKTTPASQTAKILKDHLKAFLIDAPLDHKLERIYDAQKERCKTLLEMAEKSVFFYETPTAYEEKASEKHLTAETLPVLTAALNVFTNIAESDWSQENLHQALTRLVEELKLGLGKIAPAIRVSITGREASPSLDITLCLVGKSEVLKRISLAMEWITKLKKS